MFKSIFLSRISFYGFATWLVPLLISFAFFDSSGQVTIPHTLFKSIMVVSAGFFGAWMLVLAFRQVPPTITSGMVIGCYWLGLNLLLDIIVLVPMMGTGLVAWFFDIGVRYLLLPIMAVAIGAVAQAQK